MADQETFTLEDVRLFMLDKGCKVRNHQLVTHFKKYLNHPKRRNENREKFKDFVNLLSAIKVEEGEKILVLKKRYRQTTDVSDSPSSQAWPSSEAPKPDVPSYPDKRVQIVNREYPTKDESDTSQSSFPTSASTSSLGALSNASSASVNSNRDTESSNGDGAQETTREGLPQIQLPTPVLESPRSFRAASEPPSRGSSPNPPKIVDAQSSPRSASEPPEPKEMKTPIDRIKTAESVESESPLSVKDRMRHFNKISSEADLQKLVPQRKRESKQYGSSTGGDDDDSVGSVALEPHERQWMIMSSTSDYHPIAKILLTSPQLAKKKDFITTALHWACKHGKPEVVKLICGYRTQGVNINAKSGYTPLHLAALHGHEEVVELLVSVYGADVNIRDNSGKRPKQYLSNSASSRVQLAMARLARRKQELLWGSTRRPSALSPLSIGDGDNQTAKAFSRTGSFSQRMKKTTERFSHLIKRDWGSSENVEVQRKTSSSESPKFERKGSLTKDKEVMPPPKIAPPKKKKSRKEKSKESEASDDEMKADLSPASENVLPSKSLYI